MVGVMTRYQFEGYSLDLQSYELRHQGQHIKIRRKVFNMLAYLIEQHDRVVSKAELLEHLWPGQFVAETTLTSCIMERVRLFCYDASNLNIRLPLCPVLSCVFS